MKPIWFKEYSIEDAKALGRENMVSHIGIELTELGPDYLRGTMPVDYRTRQTMGILHGGASVALAETLGSLAANLVVDPLKFACVGLDINANHIRAAKLGPVTGTAKPIHIGGSTQVWGIEIVDPHHRVVCISRITMAVLKLEKEGMGQNPFALASKKAGG